MALWHALTAADVLRELETSEKGLSPDEVAKRQKETGPNALPEGKTENLFEVFIRQFESPLIYILLGAAGVVFAIGETVDAYVILAVLFINALVGTIQEGKAESALLSLRTLSEGKAIVTRDGRDIVISDRELVPGDIVALREGERIAADARIIAAANLRVNEASLTGESEPVMKTDEEIKSEKAQIQDERNMVFKGTYVVGGTGTAVVVATGIATEIGKIAQKIVAIDTAMPLVAGVKSLSRAIVFASALTCLFIFSLGLYRGEDISTMFVTVVAVAVSVIPEGLPVALTLVLAAGVSRMSKRNVLVKRMQAVEALGHTRVIAVDKTGTITKNEMVAEKLYANGKVFTVSGNGYEPKGGIFLGDTEIDAPELPELSFAAKVAAYSSNARLSFNAETKQWDIAGDPTEAAMGVFARKAGYTQESIDEEAPKVFEVPFDYQKKIHVVVRKSDGKNFFAVTGAPEAVLDMAKKVFRNGTEEPLSFEAKKELEHEVQKLAREGFRVVAFAWSAASGKDFSETPPLVFGGFFGIRDALRPEVRETVEGVRAAGMRVVMITGDHKLTAEAIAKDAGIWKPGDRILTGHEIEELSDEGLRTVLGETSVFARVTPEHKMRIIEAYRRRGEIVAMTGDGVNDAPSLVSADLGVALGRIGTDVAKDASDIVLLDDDFGNIAEAAEEGRNVYETVRKVVLYLVSTSIGEVLVIVGALVSGFPLPLEPSQIIWLNFVTDGFLTVALALEPKEKNLLMKRSSTRRALIDPPMLVRALLMGVTMAAGTLFVFSYYSRISWGLAITMGVTVLAIFQWMNAWNCRSENESALTKDIASNRYLLGALALVVGLQVAAVYTPFLQKILYLGPLTPREWALVTLVSLAVIAVEELRKFAARRFARREARIGALK
jgi:Ca2+-transporting ATPase